jgi:hypothetical protein
MISRRQILRTLPAFSTVPLLRSQETPERIAIGGGVVEVSFQSDQFDLPRKALLEWITAAARAVTAYYGRFPVPLARLQVIANPGRRGVSNGVTYGGEDPRTRIRVGQHATQSDLERDWTMTHEFVHYGFPSVPRENHWIEEGSATYIEPIARASVGGLSIEHVWGDMARDMPQGLPAAGDQGLDRTHTWGRTYWGGAIFCLLADVEIRKQTHSRKGLVDAMRAILRAGGNITRDWPIERAFQVGDKGTGTKVLTTLYGKMAEQPVPVDLADLWRQLGVERYGDQVTLRSDAPLAGVRVAISS